ncbi:MAG: MoaD/ThiS family protein [Bacteroidota bacterium]
MPTVRFTPALQRFFPGIKPQESAADTVAKLLQELEINIPGLQAYLLDDQGQLRQHVNIFLDGEMLVDEQGLSDSLVKVEEVYIMQALSGGSASSLEI